MPTQIKANQIATDAVETVKIKNGAVTKEKLASDINESSYIQICKIAN